MAQLMPLPLTVSCFSKIQIGFAFLSRLTRVVLDKGPLNRCVCVLQFDFPFIQTFRVSRFRFRPTSSLDELAVGSGDDLGESSSEVRISTERQLQDLSNTASVWNCDGEIIDEPFIDFR